MRSLAPRAKRTWIKPDRSKEVYWESVIERYGRVMDFCNNNSDQAIKHREELFGTSTEYSYPDLYSMISLGRELVGDYVHFDAMLKDPKQIRKIAKMIAQYRLERMVETLSRHEGIVKRNEENHKNKIANAQKKSKRR